MSDEFERLSRHVQSAAEDGQDALIVLSAMWVTIVGAAGFYLFM